MGLGEHLAVGGGKSIRITILARPQECSYQSFGPASVFAASFSAFSCRIPTKLKPRRCGTPPAQSLRSREGCTGDFRSTSILLASIVSCSWRYTLVQSAVQVARGGPSQGND